MKKIIALLMVVILGLSLCACENKYCEVCNNTGKLECMECNALGMYNCRECNGGKVNCSKCDGDGTYLFEFCDECVNGRIQNPITWEWFTCSNCGGDREIPADCPQCDGKGYLDENCTTCNGEGKYTCPDCNGTKIRDCLGCDN